MLDVVSLVERLKKVPLQRGQVDLFHSKKINAHVYFILINNAKLHVKIMDIQGDGGHHFSWYSY